MRPINLSKPTTENIMRAMDLLRSSGVQQTTASIRIALEELYRDEKVNAIAKVKRAPQP